MRRSTLKLASLGAVATLFAVADVSAAVKLSDAFDGNYFTPGQGGRGVSVDYIERAEEGPGTLFGALFSYNSEGDPAWLIIQADMLEHQFAAQDVDILRFTGGTFGFPFTTPSSEVIGTASVTVNSCGSIEYDLDFDESTDDGDDDTDGFEDVLLDLQPVGGVNEFCVYQEAFAGCPSFATSIQGLDRACALNGVIRNQDVVLTNDTTWVLDGLVQVGDDNANSSTITIEPGTVIIGGGGSADYLYINPGSKIFADGLPHAPIVLTSDQDGFIEGTDPGPGDVGGLVVSGNAPSNACPDAPFNCFSEFDQTLRFGGDQENESSGSISYWQVRYAGIEFQPNAEVNSFTFQGVGDGTSVHHLQAYRGQDDGIEFFGGTVNVNYMVVTEGGDDAIDWDLGWSGKMQFAAVIEGEGFGEDFGIEGASNPDNFDAAPRATPVVSNLTLIGSPSGDAGVLFKDGSAGQVWNSVITGFPSGCLEFEDLATYDAAGTPQNPTGVSAFAGLVIDCDPLFSDEDGAAYSVGDLFNAGPNNVVADPQLDGFIPQQGSPALEGGLDVAGSDYFQFTEYRGAFDGNTDWTDIWTFRVLGGGD